MKLTEMRELLGREGLRLTKSLGQNFLHDANQLRRIVEAAELTRTDRVLEIGPGLGALTEWLLDRAGEVLSIEKDAGLVRLLNERLAARSPESGGARFTLVHDDALDYLKREPRDWSDWQLVANLPYSVASPILVELACGRRAPRRITATLQLEVARRLCAKPDNKDYGVLSLFVQLDFEPRDSFKIPPACFFPEPGVESACIRMDRRAEPLLPERQRAVFQRIVKRAFSQRRKMMLKLLRQDWPEDKLRGAFESASLSPQTRAEAVGLGSFVQLTEMLDR